MSYQDINPDKVRKNVKELAIDYLYCEIEPEKSTIYIQSMIPEIAELTVHFSSFQDVIKEQNFSKNDVKVHQV